MVFDFSASCPLIKNVSVGLNINNLFDENYTEKDGYNMPGRNFQVRAAMTFWSEDMYLLLMADI